MPDLNTRSRLTSNALLIALLTLLAANVLSVTATSAQTEDQEKAEMLVRNYRGEPVTMSFSYVFKDYSWALMEREIGIDGDLLYKFPTNLPGCEYLIDWGIDNGRLTISNDRQVICSRDISICERRFVTVDVRQQTCRTRIQ